VTVRLNPTVLLVGMSWLVGVADEVVVLLVIATLALGAYVFGAFRAADPSSSAAGRASDDGTALAAATRLRRKSSLQQRGLPDLLVCSICLDLFEHAVETSCSHAFCGTCLLEYWRAKGKNSPITCPLDRATISFIIPSHTLRAQCDALRADPPAAPADAAAAAAGAPMPLSSARHVDAQLDEYNLRFEQVSRRWAQRNMGFARTMLDDFWTLPCLHKALVCTALMVGIGYMISPFDLLPESQLGIIGLIDDVVVWLALSVSLGWVMRHLRRA
jgi:RING finger protein 170